MKLLPKVRAVALLLLSASAFGQVALRLTPSGSAIAPTDPFTLLPGAGHWVWSYVCSKPPVIHGCSHPDDIRLNWSADGGTILDRFGNTTKSGQDVYYVAPRKPGTYHLTATTEARPSASFTSTVTVIPEPPLEVSIVPFYLVLYRGQHALLQSYVLGSTDTRVVWKATGGNFTGSGDTLDFVSSRPGVYKITATAKNGKSRASATIVVTAHSYPGAATKDGTEPVDCTCVGSGRCLDVGPAQNLRSLTDVNWNALKAGDTIRLHNDGEPGSPTRYPVKFSSYQDGTPEEPIRMCGVARNNELPVLDGRNAQTRADATYYAFENLGLVWLAGTVGGPPRHDWILEGIHFANANGDLEYISQKGGVPVHYSRSASCLRINSGKDFVIRGDAIENCGNGIFVGAQLSALPSSPHWDSRISTGVLIEGNHFFDDGGGESIHEIYNQAFLSVVQGNFFDNPRSFARGSLLKSRSAGAIIRYNYFRNRTRSGDALLWFLAEDPSNNGPACYENLEYLMAAGPRAACNGGDPKTVTAYEQLAANTFFYGNIIDADLAYWFRQDTPLTSTLWFYNNTTVDHGGSVWFRNMGNWSNESAPGCWPGYTVEHACENSIFQPNLSYQNYPAAMVFNNAIYTAKANKMTWGYFLHQPLVLWNNWISSNWNMPHCKAPAKADGSWTPCPWSYVADGYENSGVYQTGDDFPHVFNLHGTACYTTAGNTCGGGLVTGSGTPFDFNSYAPQGQSWLNGHQAPLPALPALVGPLTFEYDPRSLLMGPRLNPTTVGALGAARPR